MQVNDGDDVQSLYRPVHACESLKAKEPIGWFGLTKFVELAASMHEELVFQNLDRKRKGICGPQRAGTLNSGPKIIGPKGPWASLRQKPSPIFLAGNEPKLEQKPTECHSKLPRIQEMKSPKAGFIIVSSDETDITA
ncbi:hypothetical protein OsI_00739 [Oryza sativa Indica Group]|uniref:Uncharacterized protein n=1 Tax=Oryza sativa subsp. indica TaxID=39946 RepID=A2WLM1_ORYSI|nr:hypothetical protein OsI_00739 [Oryza sativa Indica Group]